MTMTMHEFLKYLEARYTVTTNTRTGKTTLTIENELIVRGDELIKFGKSPVVPRFDCDIIEFKKDALFRNVHFEKPLPEVKAQDNLFFNGCLVPSNCYYLARSIDAGEFAVFVYNCKVGEVTEGDCICEYLSTYYTPLVSISKVKGLKQLKLISANVKAIPKQASELHHIYLECTPVNYIDAKVRELVLVNSSSSLKQRALDATHVLSSGDGKHLAQFKVGGDYIVEKEYSVWYKCIEDNPSELYVTKYNSTAEKCLVTLPVGEILEHEKDSLLVCAKLDYAVSYLNSKR